MVATFQFQHQRQSAEGDPEVDAEADAMLRAIDGPNADQQIQYQKSDGDGDRIPDRLDTELFRLLSKEYVEARRELYAAIAEQFKRLEELAAIVDDD